MYSIELRTYVSKMPHSFIVLHANGKEYGYGFYPAKEGSPIYSGIIKNDTDKHYDATTGEIPLTDQQYNDLVKYINESIQNPPEYNIFFGSQCSVWAMTALKASGVKPFSELPIDMDPHSFWEDINRGGTWSPYNIWAGIKGDWFNLNRNGKYHLYDPLVLDLDGDGIETTAAGTITGAKFDHDNDGIGTATGWVKADDGILVVDRNGDGVINNGKELFGDSTTLSNGKTASDGYAALNEFDSNGDGKVDASDAQFDKLRVWRDLNQDGISQANELFTLEQLGIKSLNLAHKNTHTNLGNGNTLAQTGSYETTDGKKPRYGRC